MNTLITIGVICFFYWMPTLLALNRKVPSLGSVVVVNLFLGWTFIGWVVALAMAARSVPASPTMLPPNPNAGPSSIYDPRVKRAGQPVA